MHLQKLEFLVEVAKTGSISSAAENLNVSQSGVRQAITRVEEDLRIKIFNRSRFGVTLTKEGINIINKSREILLKYEELKEEARKGKEQYTSDFSVSTIPIFINHFLAPLMEFRKKNENMTIEIIENSTVRTIESVFKNEHDIGVICLYGDIFKESDQLISEIILQGKMKVFVSKNSPFAVTKKITPEELLFEKFILYNGDCIKWFSNKFQQKYGNINILFSSNHTDAIARAISSGVAISFAPDFALKNNPYVLQGEIVEIELINYDQIDVSLGLIRSKLKSLSQLEKQFIRLIKSKMLSYEG
jgi:DNA-binding transcriptional LysR family regulator